MSVNECRSSYDNTIIYRGDTDNILLQCDTYEETIEERLGNLKITIAKPSLSPSSSKCSLSPSLLDDFEIKNFNQITSDELPIFSIKSLSPTGCSLSPINDDDFFDVGVDSPRFNMAISPISRCLFNYDHLDNNCGAGRGGGGGDDDDEDDDDDVYGSCSSSIINCDDIMTLDEVHEQIGTPKSCRGAKNLNLETIFEGVFLETPPKKPKKFRSKIMMAKFPDI